MWTRLNIWVMAPGNACRIDDRDGWVVYTVDAHQQPFSWKGFDYSAGTPTSENGFLDYEVPPGTYVIWAERKEQGRALRTHRAVAAVHDEPYVVVRLLPDTKPEPPDREPPDREPPDREPPDREPPKECTITIEEVRGYLRGSDLPVRFEVSGMATGCDDLQVIVRGEGGQTAYGVAHVDASGNWVFGWDNEQQFRCGEGVLVDVRCESNPNCRERAELTVDCREDG
ncbi:MAG TPA: hypothetical protein VF230_12990 [Acidimicrobiales bacterium]